MNSFRGKFVKKKNQERCGLGKEIKTLDSSLRCPILTKDGIVCPKLELMRHS